MTLYHGKALEVARTMPDGSVDCIVTSPPYFGLRDYGVDGQYGLEDSPAEYVENMRALFAELRRVLVDDGTLWLNLGDSYYSGRGNPGPNSGDEKQTARRGWARAVDRPGQSWAKPKDLLGIPWSVAFALRDDGWFLRNANVWNKPNAMPESVNDRLASRYEHVFMLSKSRRYWFDLDPIREPHLEVSQKRAAPHRAAPGKSARLGLGYPDGVKPQTARLDQSLHPKGRNPGDVWSIPTVPFAESHFAVYPPAVPALCIQAGCKPGGTVLDPCSGSGTTGMVAQQLGRKYVGIELKREYLDLSLRTRLRAAPINFEAGA
ncbi:DNA modification methylase [Mycobacteroides abscessus subsp. bolletii]|nr:DNA modification methylase [Mycobacteroides abscessus subsp. bolletii]SLD45759.1 DNA modification methylase [Mycobacteroides abscessus subsp. bolletii]SLD51139.1 DNA modification methylase [Mycobacteroides abscessus subsp. bolletii]SLE35908.1 DNA modification methylase [Mycobacteroides abscessus subsp. bolletii]